MMNTAEPELITIVEGPPPEFKEAQEVWALSVREEREPRSLALCQMRAFSGPKMLDRCRRAWSEDRPVKLDYRDESGVRRQVDVVAARWSEVEEGHVLHLWVQMPAQPPED